MPNRLVCHWRDRNFARAFKNYGGFKNRNSITREIAPNLNMGKRSTKKFQRALTINHFYEKLLLLKIKMNTQILARNWLKKAQYMWIIWAILHGWNGNAY